LYALQSTLLRSAEYKDVQQFVDSLLQPAQYLNKIEGTLMTIVKEQTPPGISLNHIAFNGCKPLLMLN
jgi:hypothetical protein